MTDRNISMIKLSLFNLILKSHFFLFFARQLDCWDFRSEIVLIHQKLQSKVFSVALRTVWPISFLLADMKAGRDAFKKNPMKEDEEEGATVSLAAAKKTSVDAAVAAVLVELSIQVVLFFPYTFWGLFKQTISEINLDFGNVPLGGSGYWTFEKEEEYIDLADKCWCGLDKKKHPLTSRSNLVNWC